MSPRQPGRLGVPGRAELGHLLPPAQRLLLHSRIWYVMRWYWPAENRADRFVTEVRPGGALVTHSLPDLDAVLDPVVPLPGGGLVIRAAVDLAGDDPLGLDHLERPCWPDGTAMLLYVLEPDGSTRLSRDLEVGCESVRLVHADRGAPTWCAATGWWRTTWTAARSGTS